MRIHLDYLLTVPLINTQGLPLNLQACEVQYTGGVSVSVLAGNTPSHGTFEEKLHKGLYRSGGQGAET